MGKRNWGEKKKQGKKLISLLMKVELVQPFQEIISLFYKADQANATSGYVL